MKAIFYILFFCALYPLYRFCERETAGFSAMKIAPACADMSGEEMLPQAVRGQRFSFLGHGGQSYAFVSEDGKYVLKLFRRRLTPECLLSWPLPAFMRKAFQKRVDYAAKKWQRDLQSYELAYEELKNETGLLYIHLGITSHLNEPIVIVDKLGIAHTIDLDRTAFAIQKKAESILPYLEHQIQAERLDEAKTALMRTVGLVRARCKMGIFDEDPRLHKNLGFIEGQPVFIDLGRFKRDERMKKREVQQGDLLVCTARLRSWLAEHEPSLAQTLDELVHADD